MPNPLNPFEILKKITWAESDPSRITQNITAQPNDPAFKQVLRPTFAPIGNPVHDNPVTALPVELLMRALDRILPIYKPQDVELPRKKGTMIDPRIIESFR